MKIKYRILDSKDLHDYKNIRLELLKLYPSYFGSSFEEEQLFDNEMWIRRLQNKNATTIGAYSGDTIIGLCVIVRNPRSKMKHKASLNSMYVKEKYRGIGVSKGLIQNVFHLLQDSDVEILHLSVVSSNQTAIQLYKRVGFVEEGIEYKAIKWNNTYYDLLLMNKSVK